MPQWYKQRHGIRANSILPGDGDDDNLTVGAKGHVLAVEDVGNNAYIGGLWQIDEHLRA